MTIVPPVPQTPSPEPARPRTVKLCLLGFGNVARAFCRLAADHEDRLTAEGLRVLIAAAGTRHGSFLHPTGVTPAEAAGLKLHAHPLPASELLERSGADVLVEATVMEDDGAPLATGHIERAFRLGMDVITVNKGPVAWRYQHLQALSESLGRRWRFEGTVADGMPVFSLIESCLRACEIAGFEAIFNATTNFIIEAVGEGRTFAEALAQVQAEGYAEADPSHDIDGHARQHHASRHPTREHRRPYTGACERSTVQRAPTLRPLQRPAAGGRVGRRRRAPHRDPAGSSAGAGEGQFAWPRTAHRPHGPGSGRRNGGAAPPDRVRRVRRPARSVLTARCPPLTAAAPLPER